jgi:CRP-like cAMP-binding protein
MSLPDQGYTTNLLLRGMAPEDFQLLQPHLSRTSLSRGDILFQPNTPIERAYFMESGVASIISEEAGEDVEVGLVGKEGFTGTPLMLGTDRTPDKSFLQIGEGSALAIPAERLLDAAQRSESLRTLLLRYAQVMAIQSARTAVANASFELPQRLARWLLMCHDRVEDDALPLTHDSMAMMLAVRRSGVTVTLHTIEGTGAISAKRGQIVIRDRARLEELAGESYGVAEQEYRRLIGPFGKSSVQNG